ncbi:hypothetical protein L596_026969 [Steinernema carpocapsae]|uniref:G-protein coupled receptors family 1 profile domain-containing protein n=1 Tax=Steinernema carpocapsae TaxID=34508 RepID=A0A4U5M3V1_STECR|nr:hypothetical protein L596_026969 [Steinernema carpocapsae]
MLSIAQLTMMECFHAVSLAKSPLIIGDLLLKVLFSVVGFILCFVLFFKERELRNLVHINAKIILFVHFLAVVFSAAAQTVSAMYDFLRFTVLKDSLECSVSLLSHNYAVAVTVPIVITQNIITLTLLALGIERTIATLMAKSYENKKNRYVSISLLAASGFITVWWLYRFFQKIKAKPVFEQTYSVITVPSEISGDTRLNTLCLAILEAIIVVLFLLILILNLKLRTKARRVNAPLGLKYQVEENLASVTVLLPMACVQVVVFTVTFALTYGLGHTHDLETDNESSLLFTNVSPLYYVALPVIWFIQARQKRKQVKRQAVNRISVAQEDTRVHFNMLKEAFQDLPVTRY